ncbi:MAG: DNA-directed RNA polymerase subunit beta [Rickettsiales bacterium]|jgi:DNA-directed RNA polymerase subunit beta|nr:DNA-directed RNA polymerase subunit beta [Rickettsiales bacterium]
MTSITDLSHVYFRKNFGKIEDVISLPNLIEVQKNSYVKFLDPENDQNGGIGNVFKSVFPIDDFTGLSTTEFVNYRLEEPKYSPKESIIKATSYTAVIRVTLRLIVWLIDEDTGTKEIKSVKEQEVYMGEIPLMTDKGTFIINGTERVVVSQLHRSPGVFFDHDKGKATNQSKLLYSARIIPYRGSWLDFEFDTKDLVCFRIDRKRKLPASTLLRALGLNTEDILSSFYISKTYTRAKDGWVVAFNIDEYQGGKLKYDLISASDNKVIASAGQRLNASKLREIKKIGYNEIVILDEQMLDKVSINDFDISKGVTIVAGTKLTEDLVAEFSEGQSIDLINLNQANVGSCIYDTMSNDKSTTSEDALLEMYKVLRPGDPPSVDAATELFNSIFFNKDRYDLSDVGRVKINERLGLDIDITLLTKEDILSILATLVSMKVNNSKADDIDHLSNRRIRSVGELAENQFRVGLVRVQRAIQERMNSVDIDTALPQSLINVKPLVSIIKEFFGTSQLSQFMDQTNPLSEITHKRRLSALGPGGLSRDRAGFEVRDVHTSHYGRICPIETPEGQNIGLINSIATFARVNQYGFLESPYRVVSDGKVTNEVKYLSAGQEGNNIIAQASQPQDTKGYFEGELITCRCNGDFVMISPKEVNYIDVSPKQIISVAASLIPFLENDDANRALMGSNMQRQAVPLLHPQSPVVGTGMERAVAHDSSACVVASHDGVIEKVDASKIFLRVDDGDLVNIEIYELAKFQRSNQDTCINQKPIVKVGQKVKKGEILADGPSTKHGELALGRNVLVGFMSWNGYNFEDSILISERIVREDVFTSIHVQEFEMVARDTRLGPEEVTRDIPNVSDEVLRHLDETGIVNVGSEVIGGDVIVGKVVPKSESPATPEEKLLRAIFGEKAAEVKDSSLYVPPGVKATVIDVRVFVRRGVEKDERTQLIERQTLGKLNIEKEDKVGLLQSYILEKSLNLLIGTKLKKAVKGLKVNDKLTEETLKNINFSDLRKLIIDSESATKEIHESFVKYDQILDQIETQFNKSVEKIQGGDDLPQGVLKVVKVFLAVKRKLQPGDKMAGRHGNKGIISKIVPIEDMPFLEDGTQLDILLNPLGVPSRMNVGQILETHLGFASYNLGKQVSEVLEASIKRNNFSKIKQSLIDAYDDAKVTKEIDNLDENQLVSLAQNIREGVPFATPVFDGAKESDIVDALSRSGVDTSGQQVVYDGRTGERFDRKVTVGYIYMLKLHHLVDEKIHARSIGPYSLVTQQPLGGKSHFGGQRFGEMECWALQAYGTAYTLQEVLTVKSDDVSGRIKLYESVVKGDSNFDYGVPESFNVMIKELKSLCINVDLERAA